MANIEVITVAVDIEDLDSDVFTTTSVLAQSEITANVTMAGPKGSTGGTGDAGAAASVSVGTTATGAPGSSASVTNSGTSSAAVFNFTIPQGETGPAGTITGITLTDADGVQWDLGITTAGALVTTLASDDSDTYGSAYGTVTYA